MKKINYILFVLSVMLLIPSCVETEDDLFEASSADRMTEALKKSREIFVGAPNGWLVKYYAGVADEKIGGVNYIFDFDEEGWVKISSEIDTDSTYRSLYRMISDQGPVLTFDTYNPVFHLLSEPQNSTYTYQGDYEFVVTEISAEEVILTGKRYGNIAVMKPFAAGLDKKQYLNEVLAMEDDAMIYSILELYKDGEKIGYGNYAGIYDAYRIKYRDIKNDSIEVSLFATYNPDGISLYEPVDINGATVSDFVWDANNHTYTGKGATSNVVIRGNVSPTYSTYENFLGTYTATYKNNSGNATKTVELVVDVPEKTFKIRGLSSYFAYVIDFNRASGTLTFKPQALTSPVAGYTANLYPWAGGGSFWATLASGNYVGVNDISGANIVIKFEPDGSISGAAGLLIILTSSSGGYYTLNADHFYTDLVLTKQ